MKNITIDTAAAWGAAIRAVQDGDTLSEANLSDICQDDVADRLGYLKTTVDGKASLAGTNSWTAPNTFTRAASGYLVAVNVIGEISLGDGGGSTDDYKSGILHREYVLPDANGSHFPIAETFIVPAITGNRTYTFNTPGANYGRRIRVVRRRTADAYTVTLAGGTTQAVISASAAGWVDLEQSNGASDWRVVGWGGTVTSIDTSVP
jgi:hypothetical protein